MPATIENKPLSKAQEDVLISQYPKETLHVPRSVGISIGIHVVIAGLVCLMFYLWGITSLRELMLKGGAIAETGPAPEQTIEIQLEDITPPPTDHVEFKKEIIKPKVEPPKTPPPPKIPPKPQEAPKRFTAPNAHGEGITNRVSTAQVGDSGLPKPSYPFAALSRRIAGTCHIRVTFDSSGAASELTINQSSGSSLLDTNTREFVLSHWKNPQLAGGTYNFPIVYDPTQR
jgi:TonB family protein